jgi:signal transduction histidine kinase
VPPAAPVAAKIGLISPFLQYPNNGLPLKNSYFYPPPPPPIIDIESRIDDFCLSLNAFFSSPVGSLYQIHRPEGIQYLQAVNSAASSLKTAINNNDNTTLYLTAVEIDQNLDSLQRIDKSLSNAGQRNSFFLFLFFSMLVITVILILVIQYARLDKAEKREQQSLAFSRETIIAQERERLRIARELHDTVAQDLWRLSFQTESIDKAEERNERSKLCAEVVKEQKEVMQRVRNICDNLIPPDFRRRRFDDALRNLCYNFEKRTGIECQLVIQENLPYGSLDGDTQLQSFRVAQECLSNIEKHAGASKTSVIVRSIKEGELVICVSDNGKGFSPPDRDSLRSDGGHYGLWNIYERAASIQAEVSIDSEEGEGTTVTLKIPFKLGDR